MKSTISKMKKQVQRGFTLVEIAIVLVIIGLLIGGVLRGQELLNSARVNSLNSQQSSIQTAFYGFIDRYKTTPGDLTAAQALLINNLAAPASAGGDGVVAFVDSPAFFNNLSQAGFLACTPCSATSLVTAGAAGAAATYIPPTSASGANTMVNVYGAPLMFQMGTTATLVGGSTAGAIEFLAATAEIAKPMVTTGNTVTSAMLAEMDRKVDDGNPAGGTFRYTDNGVNTVAAPKVSAAVSGACWTGTAATAFTWVVNPPGNCQGGTMF
jgi:prepilin-type N-terminal cleavage/methylation domain-containing protein